MFIATDLRKGLIFNTSILEPADRNSLTYEYTQLDLCIPSHSSQFRIQTPVRSMLMAIVKQKKFLAG